MENGTKALMMAASVLIAMIVIGSVVYMYNSLSETQRQTQTSAEIEQITEYNKQFEKYNAKILYGSDILSVANLIDNYNSITEDEKYTQMSSKVTLTRGVLYKNRNNATVGISKAGTYTIQEIRKYFVEEESTNAVNNQINALKKTYSNLEELYKMYQVYLKKGLSTMETDYEKEIEKNKVKYKSIENVNADMNDYQNYQLLLTEFKSIVFTCKEAEYDSLNGRMIKINFKQASA